MTKEDFQGVIGRYRSESTPWWPPEARPPDGAPSVLIIVLDDVGFAQLGCFGSDIETPVLDSLAAGGLRYTNFHTTALCSPTRACLLTGRNHHSTSMGRVTDLPTGFPGYYNSIPKSCGFLSEMLVPRGYAAYAVGKWHLTPDHEYHMGASRARWPLGRGFERFYGFFGGETNQFAPSLVHDNHYVPQPRAWEDGYHLTEDLVDHAVEFLRDLRAVDPRKPFFLYFCPAACHSPHQAPRARRHRHRGTERNRRRRAAAHRGYQFCREPQGRHHPQPPRHAVLRDARLSRDLPPRLEGRRLPPAVRPAPLVRRRSLGALPRR